MTAQELGLQNLPARKARTPWLDMPSAFSPKFELHRQESPGRREIEAYIHAKFKRAYGAEIDRFLPQLLTVNCRRQLTAAMGIRKAEQETLYLENYFDEKIETVLSGKAGAAVSRNRIVEIGNLVSTWRGSSQLLFLFTALLLHRLGREWVVFTATPEVEKLLRRMHFSLYLLGEASREQVGDDAEKWGDYYSVNPQVMAGYVPGAVELIHKHALTAKLAGALAGQVDQAAIEWTR